MVTFLYILHFLVSIGIIVVILFQSEVGEGFGFMGGETTFYKAKKRMEKGLKQATVVLAVLFMITSVLIFVIH
ncbi:MAG TPA: preprotein translocase subunit SecG [Dictyoglomaceae bacterium]|nr:preprotein translocase subunit SecG [Dictyoglomaceae bacterium]HPP15565.1 preprotein translocase subunit SecG [Dictyoglomaceae bacterium]